MRLGELDIPDAVLDARDRGELLVFAGAGVSMGGTAQYPNFGDLVQEIENNSGRRWRNEALDGTYDRYLGSLQDNGVDVHEATKRILTNPASLPNPIHWAIVRLFSDTGAVRIVTTNFDEHFSSVATADISGTVSDYAAPALPQGNSFSGIVYIHGCVHDRVNHLVLTDRDFGKAYSTEGWARRFLIEAFRKYTVLFVGYSHNDPPMRYLTRGLTPETDAIYAISDEKANEHWRHLGIKPISYNLRRKSPEHGAVEDGICAWAEHAGMLTLDHKAKIATILKKAPATLSKSEDSYLQRCFRKRELLRFFYDDGLNACWLLWAEDEELLTPVFRAASASNQSYDQHVAHWFSQHAVKNNKEALSVYMRAEMAMPEHLWYQIGRAYHGDAKESQPGRAKWAAQLCMHWSPAYSTEFLEYAMIASAEDNDIETAMMLLQFLSTPRIVHERAFQSYSNPREANTTSARVKINATGSGHWFEELWNKHLKSQLAQYGVRLAEIATNKLGHVHELQVVHNAASKGYDAVSWHRSAIEPSDQDEYRSEFDILVDIARDSLEYLIKAKRGAALSLQARWAVARSPLLMRLAIHAMRIDKRRLASTKLKWVIDSDYLALISLHHEVFLLVCDTFPAVHLALQKVFLSYLRKVTRRDIRKNPDKDEGVYWHHEFSLLDQLQAVTDGKCRMVTARLLAIRKKFPEFKVSDHPEFTHYTYGVQNGSQSPLTASELRAKSPDHVVRYLIHFKGDDWSGPNRDGLTWVLQSVVKEVPEWGLDIAQCLAKRKRYPNDIWPTIVRGWSSASMDAGTWHEVLALLQSTSIQALPLRETAQLLYHGLRDEDSIPDKELTTAEHLAFSVLSWSRVSSSSPGASENWYSWALNDSGGIICEFLIFSACKRRQKAKDKWKGLSLRYKQQFKRMLGGRTMTDQAGRTILAAHIHYLYAWDSVWTIDFLLPAFDWVNGEVAATQIWHGFLGNGKWNRKYLQRMLPYYRQSVAQSQKALQSDNQRLAIHVAHICLYSESRRARGHLLVDFFHAASEKQRVAFASTISSMLHKASLKERHAMWTSWLCNYWHERNLGKPVPLCPEELKEMIAWCPFLSDDFPDAVHVLTEGNGGEGCDVSCLRGLFRTGLAAKYPEATASFLFYLVDNHGHDYMHTKDVLEIGNELVKDPKTHRSLDELVELLARKGHIQEAEEIRDAVAKSAI